MILAMKVHILQEKNERFCL